MEKNKKSKKNIDVKQKTTKPAKSDSVDMGAILKIVAKGGKIHSK